MSLILSQDAMWDMPLISRKGEKHIPHLVGNGAYIVLGSLSKLLWRYHIDGKENLLAFKGKSGVVLISNHTSFFDILFIYLSVRPDQWTRFMARDNFFSLAGGLLGQLFSRCGAIPLKRDSADRTALKRASAALKRCEPVLIMPEGTRRGRGTGEVELHSGAAFIARMGKAPILPMTVRDAEHIKEKGRLPRFPRITIEFGTPLLLKDFDFLPKSECLQGCSWYAMRECFSLSKRLPRDKIDMPSLFPESKDFTELFAQHAIPEHNSLDVASTFEKRLQELS